ncbi:MAG: trypsin-like peptidase domain-containing protein [Phycisphaeraceae bacterium]|nr:trypsin-like peptidase domain-containing protein [Phycisphaeraceae bacterium]
MKNWTLYGILGVFLVFGPLVMGSGRGIEGEGGSDEAAQTSRPQVANERESLVAPRVPSDLDELRKIQERTREVVASGIPATVGLTIGASQGSGVIVDAEGLILTAGHVSGAPGRRVVIRFHDGSRAVGETLGRQASVDSGMVRITSELPEGLEEWPHVPIARSGMIRAGDWSVAIGHPGGYQQARGAVVRVGRVVASRSRVLWTDCALVGGDSGGPLFDMSGRVIGIHSRISVNTSGNFHVPIDLYLAHWDDLVAGKAIGGDSVPANRAFLGISGEDDEQGCRVTRVFPESAAERAGLRPDDVIVSINNRAIGSMDDLQRELADLRPGQRVRLGVLREGRRRNMTATLGEASGFEPDEGRVPE